MVRLSLHWTNSGIHEEHPIGHLRDISKPWLTLRTIERDLRYLDGLPCPLRIRYLMILIVSGGEISTHRTHQRLNLYFELAQDHHWSYCIMLPLSKIRIALPSVKVSVIAGILPLGLISRNLRCAECCMSASFSYTWRFHSKWTYQGSFWVFLENSIFVVSYGNLAKEW